MDALGQEAFGDWSVLLDNDSWQVQPYHEIIRGVLADAEAARVFPHCSMETLCLSRCPEYPFDYRGLPQVTAEPPYYRLDDGPLLDLQATLQALLPRLRAARVYAGGYRDEMELEAPPV